MTMLQLYLVVALAPLVGAIVVGLWGPRLGRSASHWICIIGVAISTVGSAFILRDVMAGNTFNGDLYVWMTSGGIKFAVGFLIDPLTALMLVVVTFVSLMVHIYTIGYMADDPGYTRFFSYISLFTFSMLMLVMSNNFLQLFFGWEAVGLVSYLLIGFWYERPTAIYANLKAFLANRVGDFGFALGIGLIVAFMGSLDYASVFAAAPKLTGATINLVGNAQWSILTAICIGLFIGAMGKSAQVPLHVWLPDSMEGPTPISALIHAATMVTAGIFMVARMSPLFELSDTALSLRHRHRRDYGAVHGGTGPRAERHQARRRLFDVIAARLHDGRAWRVRVFGGDISSDDARFLQGAPVPRCRLGHHRPASRAGHAPHGRPQEIHAHHLLVDGDRVAGARRHPAVRRLFLEGRHHRSRAPVEGARTWVRPLCRDHRRIPHRLVFVPPDLHDVPRRRAVPSRRGGRDAWP